MKPRELILALLPWVFAPAALAQDALQDHQYSTADVEAGSRLYADHCALCHGPTGDTVSGVDLRRGQFRQAVSDADLTRVITTGVPGGSMPATKLPPREVELVVAFLRAGMDVRATAVKVGDPGRGRTLFEGKGQCGTCHRVNGVGPRAAPDLTDIGALRTPTVLQRVLVDPSSALFPINRPIRAVTRDGRTIRGRRLNEDTFTVQVLDEEERLLSLVKTDLRDYEVLTTPTMPAAPLSLDEVADVVAYLLTLKGLP